MPGRTQTGLAKFPPLSLYSDLSYCFIGASQMAQIVKNPAANPGDMGSIPGSGRSPEEGYSNPLQDSCLENPMDRRVWRAIVHRVTKS